MNADLQQFVRDSLSRGMSRDAIRTQLDQAGWRSEEIDAALAAWAEADFPVPVPRRRSQLSAREAFLYLVLFVTLYVTAFNVGALLFQFIERWLPDLALTGGYSGVDRFNPQAVRNAIAPLLIAYPVFLFLSRFIGRQLLADPEKRGSGVRRWLTYVTLFVAALVILGDLSFLVARLLSGELPPRFLARTLVVFLIAGYVFGHYLSGLRREEEARHDRPVSRTPRLVLPRIAGALVWIVIAGGFVAAGSPRQARAEEIDARRVRELQHVSSTVEDYYREHRELPASLDTLAFVPGPDVSTRDPVTREPYGYRSIDSTHYELCATFDHANTGDDVAEADRFDRPSRFWRHPAGRRCFELALPRLVIEGKR